MIKRKHLSPPKVVSDPLYGVIDIRPVLPMTRAREFQALSDKRQLGMSYLVFPSATHTRMAHSLGSYHATVELAGRWADWGFIKEKQARALSAYALYHDIGHPALSHITEDLCENPDPNLSTNTYLSLKAIKKLKKLIQKADIDYDLLLSFAKHENPIALGVHDKNLGMEKLDYLERDGMYTILSRPAGIDYLRKHIYLMDDKIVIDEKVIDNAIEAQNFYLKMYKNVYLRKPSVIAQRMLQKMTYNLIQSGELERSELPELTDSELIGKMYFSKNENVQYMYGLLQSRNLYRETIVIRPNEFVTSGAQGNKSIATFGVSAEKMKAIIECPLFSNKNQEALTRLEDKLAKAAGTPKNSILLVSVFNAWRFKAQDISILYAGGSVGSLKERHPAHFESMEEVARSYAAFRICTLDKYRKLISSKKIAETMFQIIKETAGI